MNKLKQIIDMLQDEKIIEEIIGFIQWAVDRGSITEKQREKSDLWIIWLEKRAEQKTVSKTEPIIEGLTTEFQKQVSHLIASAINKEHEYNQSYIKWTANALLNYAKQELEKQGEQKPTEDNCRISDCVEKVDMTEYNNGYECGKQRVLKYPEDYGLCKKYVWSEEDEVFLKDCISTIYSANTSKSKAVLVHWLKSFKERMKGE